MVVVRLHRVAIICQTTHICQEYVVESQVLVGNYLVLLYNNKLYTQDQVLYCANPVSPGQSTFFRLERKLKPPT